jgi:hypothetical protein
MKFNSWDWVGRTTKEKASAYAEALNKMGYSLQYIDAQLCSISNLSVKDIHEITNKFVN